MDNNRSDNVFDLSGDELAARLRRIDLPGGSRKLVLAVLAIVVLLVVGFGAFYQVQPEEVGIVLRFGRYVRTSDPGLRLKIPLFEQVLKVPVQRQLKQEFGFRTVEAGVRTRYSEQQFDGESVMLTGDLNVAVVEWIVQYRVADPYKYLFRVRNVEQTFRAMNEAVMRQVVGNRTVTEVLTVGRLDIETTVMTRLQQMCDQYETGITVDQVVLQDVNPPDPVKPSWDEVNQAQQQRDRLINEARAEYNQVIPRAKGEAEQTVLQAEGYALDRVNRAQGDAARFVALYDEYRRAPEVTEQRLYLETLQDVLPKLGGKLFLDEEAEGILPLLPMETLRSVVPGGGSGGGTTEQEEGQR